MKRSFANGRGIVPSHVDDRHSIPSRFETVPQLDPTRHFMTRHSPFDCVEKVVPRYRLGQKILGTADRLCDRQVGRFATASLVRLTEMVG